MYDFKFYVRINVRKICFKTLSKDVGNKKLFLLKRGTYSVGILIIKRLRASLPPYFTDT